MTLRGSALDERGQVIVLVGATITVLLGSLALAVDWGYGLAVRRAMQNSADAAALAVGKTLATSTIVIEGELRFLASDEQLWERASALVDANKGLAEAVSFTLEYGNESVDWTESEGDDSDEWVPDDTVYVRVRTSVTYRSLVAAVIGVEEAEAGASARVRLSGATTPMGPVLPLLRHFNEDVFSASCAGSCNDPTDADPICLWRDPGGDDEGCGDADLETFDQFEGIVDLSRYSHSESTVTTQLLEDWDRTGSASAGTPLKDDHSDRECEDDVWDTAGNEDDNRENQRCSVPNWFYYSYGGTVSVASNYTGAPSPQEPPTTFDAASQTWCALTDAAWQATYGFTPDPRAACDRGDWIETVPDDLDRDMADALEERVEDEGVEGVLSGLRVASGDNDGDLYGDAITVFVLLWDCGEEYDRRGAPGDRWGLILPETGDIDCTQLPSRGRGEETPDRVHVLTVAPFTIYESLVSRDAIRGYWGGAFGDPPAGPPRPLWVFANTAYLVPDE